MENGDALCGVLVLSRSTAHYLVDRPRTSFDIELFVLTEIGTSRDWLVPCLLATQSKHSVTVRANTAVIAVFQSRTARNIFVEITVLITTFLGGSDLILENSCRGHR